MKSNIFPVSALLIAIGIFFVYIQPTWSGSIATTKSTIAADKQALEAAAQYATEEQQLEKERDAIAADDLARLKVFLPDSVDNVRLILDLNGLAARSGVSLSGINVATPDPNASNVSAGAASPTDPVGSVDLSLTAVGTYAAFHTFLSGIERSQRLLDIKDLSLSGSDTGVYTYQMMLRLYWLR